MEGQTQGGLQQAEKAAVRTPILKLPHLERPFVLRTDSLDRSVGAVLLQEDDGVFHPVTYVSRKLLPREAAYETVKRAYVAQNTRR